MTYRKRILASVHLGPHRIDAPEDSPFRYTSGMLDIDEQYDSEAAARAERAELYVESRGGLERCICCGRYRYGDALSKDGMCLEPCRDSNEF